MGVGKDWFRIDFERSYKRKEAEIFWPHHKKKENSIEKQIIHGAVKGRRGRGRPATAWTDGIKEWTERSMSKATTLARDRRGWRALMKTTAVPMGTT